MSTITPPTLEGSQAPSSFELLWEKHRGKINLLLAVLVAALALNYGYKFYRQKQIDKVWGGFAVTSCLENGYDNKDAAGMGAIYQAQAELAADLARRLGTTDLAKLEAALPAATGAQKPFLMWMIAYSAFRHRDWNKAEATLDQLQKEFPEHVLVKETSYPVQFRNEKKSEQEDKDTQRKRPELEPQVAGRAVERLRASIAAAKEFKEPEHFKQAALPADAPKYEIKFKGDFGKVVIALWPEKAPKHAEKFAELVKANHWNGVRVDEVRRPGNTMFQKHQPMQMHFGYLTTVGQADRTKWRDTEPSKQQVDYEVNDLSHFPGAVAAQMDGEKSSVDRIWINVTDNAGDDGQKVVFGYVVEGLDNLKKICELGLGGEKEENAGTGTPSQDVEIESITKL